MCLSKNTGFKFLNLPKKHKLLFGEDQSRYLIAFKELNLKKINNILNSRKINFVHVGKFSDKNLLLNFPDKSSIKLDDIKNSQRLWENKV